ncbi:MAG: hypothetical protein HY885_08550 [Deltaproteobacteria bacterium]|nr:hypothetical protein [Deltaproteobacteria bacterium]
MLSLRHDSGTVNADLSLIHILPSHVKPPIPDFPGCQVVINHGCSDFKIGGAVKSFYVQASSRGDRAAIVKFSSRSRKNLLKKLFSLPLYPSLFLTLTYPKYFPAESHEWKRHLDNFRRVLLDKFPKAWFFWKLEPQKRGAPHYHLIGDLGEEINIHLLRQYVSYLWFEVCGTGYPAHLAAGTNVEVIKDSERKMQAYVCKYIGKVDNTEYAAWSHPGRFWGIIGRKNLPEALSVAITMDAPEYYVVRRLIRRWLKSISPKSKAYAKRLAHIPSFFVLIPKSVVHKIIDLVVGAPPF